MNQLAFDFTPPAASPAMTGSAVLPAPKKPPRLSDADGVSTMGPTPVNGTPINLAEVRAVLKGRSSDQVTRNVCSALSTFQKVTGKPLSALPADPVQLGPIFATANPALVRVGPQRWMQVRNLVRAGLRATGVPVMPGRSDEPPSAAWRQLADRLPTKEGRNGLSRLTRFFTRRGVEPEDLSLADFEAFREALPTALIEKPHVVYADTIRIWNKAVVNIVGWPRMHVPTPCLRETYALPEQRFEASFREDVRAFTAVGQRQATYFDEKSGRSLRAVTSEKQRAELFRLASALVLTGHPIEAVRSLGDLVDHKNAKSALGFLLLRADNAAKPGVVRMAELLVTASRTWCGTAEDRESLKLFAANLRAARPDKDTFSPKNIERMRQFFVAENVALIMHLPERIFSEAAKMDQRYVEPARRSMYALAVELLSVVPLRRKNLVGLRIGTQLRRIGSGQTGSYRLVFGPDEMKGKRSFEAKVPVHTAQLIETFIERYRPVLSDAPGDFLFPSPSGGARNQTSFSAKLSQFIARETGLQMHMHLFRHLAAFLYLSHHPDDIETVRLFLGHGEIETTLKYYAFVKPELSFERLDALVASLRSRGGV